MPLDTSAVAGSVQRVSDGGEAGETCKTVTFELAVPPPAMDQHTGGASTDAGHGSSTRVRAGHKAPHGAHSAALEQLPPALTEIAKVETTAPPSGPLPDASDELGFMTSSNVLYAPGASLRYDTTGATADGGAPQKHGTTVKLHHSLASTTHKLSIQVNGVHTMSRPLTGAATTASHLLQPGPYHRTNALLRARLMHLHVDVLVRREWPLVVLWVFSAVTFAAYLASRIYYLANGYSASVGMNVSLSIVLAVSELAQTMLGCFCRSITKRMEPVFYPMQAPMLTALAQVVANRGVSQTVHVLVTVYSEPTELVRECVLRLLVAPEPIYMEKIIWVCDDGYRTAGGKARSKMVDDLNALGHHNVRYAGGRVLGGQLNGKSANVNHAVLNHIYPGILSDGDIPERDILMLMDCDHMVKPDIFVKMGACMRDPMVASTLVPQSYHNVVHPDGSDIANANFNHNHLPYVYGSGCAFLTGTNFMVRTRCVFRASRFYDADAGKLVPRREGELPHLFSEDDISEDVELGSRIHAAGYKSVFIGENLATGEVPVTVRALFRQRLRWFKGGHLFVLNKHGVCRCDSPHVSLFQKSVYAFGAVSHYVSFFTEPISAVVPFLCLVCNQCTFGVNFWMFITHVLRTAGSLAFSCYGHRWALVVSGISSRAVPRIQWATGVKACINTAMVLVGFKRPPWFKVTPKAATLGAQEAVSSDPSLEHQGPAGSGNRAPDAHASPATGAPDKQAKTEKQYRAHAALSRITSQRKRCMPMDGNMDIWAITGFTALSMAAVIRGTIRIVQRDGETSFGDEFTNVLLLGMVMALVDTVPGVLLLMHMAVYKSAPWIMKIWTPLVITIAVLGALYAEIRLLVVFIWDK